MKIFVKIIPPTRHMYKRIDFTPSNKSITTYKRLSTNLEQFLRRINSPLMRYISRVNCPKLAEMAIFKPPNFTKNDHTWNIFSKLSSGQQYFSNDKIKFRQKWLVKKSKFVWRKKKPTPSTNIPLLSYQKSEQKERFRAL